MEYKSLIKYICMFIVSITVCIFCVQTLMHKSYDVTGTIVSKNIEQYAHDKNNISISKRYIICIKPDNINKFKHYKAYIDYATYCTYNVGDKVTFPIYGHEHEYLKDFKYSIWIEKISCIMFFIFSFSALFACVSIIMISGESYESHRDDLL